MTLNPRVGFKERQRKRLFKALLATPSPAKRTRPEVSHEELVLDVPMAQVPPFDIARSGQELFVISSAEKDAFPTQDMTPIGHTLNDDINDKDVPISFPSWEEITTLLRQVPYFTALEPPTTSIDAFFLLTHRYFVDMLDDPPTTVVPHPPTTFQNLFFGYLSDAVVHCSRDNKSGKVCFAQVYLMFGF